jgi:glutathione S-transferase
VLRWCFTALTTIELPVLSLWFVNLTGGQGSAPSDALQGWAEMRLKQLDGWMSHRQFVATEDFSVADILMSHVLDAGTRPEMLKAFPHLLAYRSRCTERPAWRKTVEAYRKRVEPT